MYIGGKGCVFVRGMGGWVYIYIEEGNSRVVGKTQKC